MIKILFIKSKGIAIVILSIFISLLTLNAFSEELTIEESIEVALENSREYREALLRLRTSEIEYKNAKAAYMMEVDLNMNVPQMTWFQRPYYTPGIPYRFLYTEEYEKYKGEFQLSQPLPTGGSFILSSAVTKADSYHYYSLSSSEEEYTEYISDLTLTITQPVLKENVLKTVYRKAQVSYFKERNNFDKQRNEIIYKIRSLYYNVVSACKTVEINLQSVEQSASILEITKEKFTHGMISKLEYLSAEVELMNSQSILEEVKAAKFNAIEQLKSYLNLDFNKDYDFEYEITPEGDEEIDIAIEKLIEMALDYSPEIKNLNYDIQILQMEYRILKRERLPSGIVSGTYGYEGRGEDMDTSMDEFDKSNWTVMFTINVPVFDWGRLRNRIHITENNIESLDLQYLDSRKQIELIIRSEYRNLESARHRLEINLKNREKAIENYRLAEARYKLGLATFDSVQSAKISFMQAEFNLLKAKIDRNLSILKIKKEVGLSLQ